MPIDTNIRNPAQNRTNFISPWMIVIATIMGIKSLYMAFFVTPLWDIPDEFGHLAYAMQIANGGGIPVLGQATIPAELVSHVWQEERTEIGNWIAQHPPLYYFIAALPYWIAQHFSTDPDIIYRSTRLVAVFSAPLLLIVIYRTGIILGLGERAAMFLSGSIGWIPMVTHMSSGTNHDIPLFLMSAISFHYMVRYILNQRIRDAYFSAFYLSMACAIKMTAWLLIPPFFLILAWELKGPLKEWLFHLSGATLLAVSTPTIWMVRNSWVYGKPLETAVSRAVENQSHSALDLTFIEFLSEFPVIEHFLLNFYGLIGWVGTGVGELRWFQIAGLPSIVFTALLVGVSAVLFMHVLKIALRRTNGVNWIDHRFIYSNIGGIVLCPSWKIIISVFSVFSFLVSLFILTTFNINSGLFASLRLYAFSLIVALGASSIFLLLIDQNNKNRIFYYGLAAFYAFAMVIFWEVYKFSIFDGQMRATHGRYFYPVVPWLLGSISLSLLHLHWRDRLLGTAFLIFVISEIDAYVYQVFPFIGFSIFAP